MAASPVADDPVASDDSPTVWLWDRDPGTTTLVKVLIPADAVPAEDLPSLQRRYAAGDRVQFTYDHDHPDETGTVVQDQGIYVAIDGDRPGTAFTIGKVHMRPTNPASTATSTRSACPTGSPHKRPDIRTDAHTVSAYWDLGAPDDGQWRRRACLRVYHAPGYGYLAVLTTVDECRDAGLLQQPPDVLGTVIHVRPTTRRPSATGLRTTLTEALTILRALFDTAHADIVCYFTASPTNGTETAPVTTSITDHIPGARA